MSSFVPHLQPHRMGDSLLPTTKCFKIDFLCVMVICTNSFFGLSLFPSLTYDAADMKLSNEPTKGLLLFCAFCCSLLLAIYKYKYTHKKRFSISNLGGKIVVTVKADE